MISDYYSFTLAVKRLVLNETTNISEEVSAGSITGQIQQTTEEKAQTLGIAFDHSYTLWTFPTSDIKEGDKLTDQDNKVYTVRGVKTHKIGNYQHIEAVLETPSNA